MTRLFLTIGCVLVFGSLGGSAASGPGRPALEVVENLTLEQALELAERLHPDLAEARAGIEAAEGRARQAGAFPNPEAIVGAQQLPLRANAANEREYVAGVAQTVPLSRRLSRAREAEGLEREVRARGLEVKHREIRQRVHNGFATALYQEQAWQVQGDLRRIAEQVVTTTRARREAGDALGEDLARVELELARVEADWQRAESLRRQALVALAAALGDATISVQSLAGDLETAFEIPTLEDLAMRLADPPEVALAEADVRVRNARVELAHAERIPDVKVEVLYHRLEASGADTLDVGLSLPLPLFQRNHGRLREAQAELAAAEARARLTRSEVAARRQTAQLQLETALAQCRQFRTGILERADTVLRAAEARYAAGDISLTELLPVRRERATMQLSYLESLREVMQAWAAARLAFGPSQSR
jgi:cobalt-zinc-cadmium efflux system outer membrane protein